MKVINLCLTKLMPFLSKLKNVHSGASMVMDKYVLAPVHSLLSKQLVFLFIYNKVKEFVEHIYTFT